MMALDAGTARFIKAAQRAPRLSRDEEIALFERIRSGDRAAKDRLVEAHLRDVVFIALKHRRYGVLVADLIAEGNLGLLRAIEKFESERGVRFSTYAAHWIRSFVVGHVLGSWSMVCPRTGVLRTKIFFKLRRERTLIEGTGANADDTIRLLAERLGFSERKIAAMLARIDSRDLSLDGPVRGDSATTLGESFASDDDTERTCDEHRVSTRLGELVTQALGELDPRERLIANRRWLATPEEELSLAEIGRTLGVSRERARQLEARARKRIAVALAKAGGVDQTWLDSTAA